MPTQTPVEPGARDVRVQELPHHAEKVVERQQQRLAQGHRHRLLWRRERRLQPMRGVAPVMVPDNGIVGAWERRRCRASQSFISSLVALFRPPSTLPMSAASLVPLSILTRCGRICGGNRIISRRPKHLVRFGCRDRVGWWIVAVTQRFSRSLSRCQTVIAMSGSTRRSSLPLHASSRRLFGSRTTWGLSVGRSSVVMIERRPRRRSSGTRGPQRTRASYGGVVDPDGHSVRARFAAEASSGDCGCKSA